jgi:biopolymer transport protein TolR
MSKRRKAGLHTVTEINVTPLVDLTFLLLITFIILAPVMEFTVNVNPPELTTTTQPKDVPHKIVTINSTGQFYLGDELVTESQLLGELTDAVAAEAELQVYIRGDENCPYGQIVAVMRAVKQAGVKDFSLLTRQEDEP